MGRSRGEEQQPVADASGPLPTVTSCPVRPDSARYLSEALGEQAVSQAAVADSHGVRGELAHHGTHDAGAGEDDLGARRLQPDDGTTLLGVPGGEEPDLPVDLRRVE